VRCLVVRCAIRDRDKAGLFPRFILATGSR
jgi:hypothetical protein